MAIEAAKRAQVIGCLVEGMSIRSTCRITDVAKGTVTKLLVDLGEACFAYMDQTLVDLPCERIQADEIWAFVGKKAARQTPEERAEFGTGDVWTWVAIDAGLPERPARPRHQAYPADHGHVARVPDRRRGHLRRAYLTAVEATFGHTVDYAQLHKIYGTDPNAERRARATRRRSAPASRLAS